MVTEFVSEPFKAISSVLAYVPLKLSATVQEIEIATATILDPLTHIPRMAQCLRKPGFGPWKQMPRSTD